MPATRTNPSEERQPSYGVGSPPAGGGSIVPRSRLVERLVAGGGAPDRPDRSTRPGFGKSTVLAEWADADPRPFARLTLERAPRRPGAADGLDRGARSRSSRRSTSRSTRPCTDREQGTLKVAVPRLLESLQRADAAAGARPRRRARRQLPRDARGDRRSRGRADPRLAARAGRARGAGDRHQPPARQPRSHRAARGRPGDDGGRRRTCCCEPVASSWSSRASRCWWSGPRAGRRPSTSRPCRCRDADDADRAAREFAGDERIVSDYLRDEFVATPDRRAARLPDPHLDRRRLLSGDLCDAVLDDDGLGRRCCATSRATTRWSARWTRSEHTFRYHALLREMLGSELHRSRPREKAELHARASRWFEAQGDIDRAVPHAIATGDIDLAGDLIWSHAATPTRASGGRRPCELLAGRLLRAGDRGAARRSASCARPARLSLGDGAAGRRTGSAHALALHRRAPAP